MKYLGFLLFACRVVCEQRNAMASIRGSNTKMSESIEGTISFKQVSENDYVDISVSLSGLSPNSKYGFHVHSRSVTGQDCSAAGPHFNPMNVTHGAPNDDIKKRHFGDLGNIVADSTGQVTTTLSDPLLSMFGPLSIGGLAIVIHENQDDLGRGNTALSKVDGNSGSAIACGNILINAKLVGDSASSSKVPTIQPITQGPPPDFSSFLSGASGHDNNLMVALMIVTASLVL